MAAQKNFQVDENSTFSFEVQYLDEDNEPIPLHSFTAKMQVRDTQGGKNLAFTLSDIDGLYITPVTGKITVSVSPDRTKKLFYPKSAYDLVIIDSSNNITRLLEGYLTLNRAVTL